jgi:hypothetical protein
MISPSSLRTETLTATSSLDNIVMSAREAVAMVLQRKSSNFLEQSDHIGEDLLTNYYYAEDKLPESSLDHCLGLLSYVG